MNIAMIFAGGSGVRMGAGMPKQFLQVNGKNILFDCGKGNDDTDLYNPNFDTLLKNKELNINSLSQLDCIFVSHAHFDHIGYLMNLISRSGVLPIYSTHLTKHICSYTMQERIRKDFSVEQRLEYKYKMDKVLGLIDVANYGHKYEISSNFNFTFYPAGHIPGAAMVYIEIDGINILYTGDFSMIDTPLAPSCELPDISPDIIVACGTHAKHPQYNPTIDIERNVINLFKKNKNRNIYFGVKQLTKGIELLQIIRTAMNSGKIEKKNIFVDPNIWEFAKDLETKRVRIFDANCDCFKRFFDFDEKPNGICIGDTYYNRFFNFEEAQIPFTIHATYENLSDLLKKYMPKTVFIVHSVEDRQNKYGNKLAYDFPQINVIYANDNEIFDLTKEGLI